MNLRLFDVSAYIHAGKVNTRANYEGDSVKTDKGWMVPSIPTGGVAFLFNTIEQYIHRDLLVYAGDRDSLFRKEIDPMYKANRIDDPNVKLQQRIVEHILKDCNINYLYMDRYEADDILYTCSKKNKNKQQEYEHIYIHANDSDVFMNVDDFVSIAPVRKKDKEVNMSNYTTSFGKKGFMPYNECNLMKMLNGDTSDNYKGLESDEIAKKLIAVCQTSLVHDRLGDSEIFGDLLGALCPEAVDKYKVAYPHLLDIDFDPYIQPNFKKIKAWGYLIGNKGYSLRDISTTSTEYIEARDYLDSLLDEIVMDQR